MNSPNRDSHSCFFFFFSPEREKYEAGRYTANLKFSDGYIMMASKNNFKIIVKKKIGLHPDIIWLK